MLMYKYINVNTNICYIDFNEYKYNKINNKIIQYNNNNNNNNNNNDNNNNNKTHHLGVYNTKNVIFLN